MVKVVDETSAKLEGIVNNNSEQLVDLDSNIVGILDELTSTTTDTLKQVKAGKSSVEEGAAIMDKFDSSFKTMTSSFDTLNKNIQEESQYIKDIHGTFSTMME